MVPDGVVSATTPDGWILPVRHYEGGGPPVLLVHGMSANHYNFDYRPEVSLAHYLQDAGFDVWVPELRGDPGAIGPATADFRDVTFDDLAQRDLPAIVDKVLATTGAPKLLWVGHSMGGILLYTALASYPDKLDAGVAISSPADFDHGLPIYKAALKTRFLVKGDGVLPTRGLAKMFADLGLARSLEGRLAHKQSIDGPMLRGMAKNVLWPVPHAEARQALAWIDHHELVKVDGSPWLHEPAVAGPPLLVMGGPIDGIVSAADAADACRFFSPCAFIDLSESGGFSHDYGHVDPVVGRTAALEVFPQVARFLRAQAAPTAQAQTEVDAGPALLAAP